MWGACGSLDPSGHDVYLVQALGLHTTDNCVVLAQL